MKKEIAGFVFLFLGVQLIALSGLEKVLLVVAINDGISDLEMLISQTPSYIWRITNSTFWFGVVFFIIGLDLLIHKWLKKHFNQTEVT